MDLTVIFIEYLLLGLFYSSPVLIFLILVIVGLGQHIGRKEGWSRIDALYYSFITATTVGYGDFRPNTNRCKLLAVAIAFVGLLLTGILVGIGVNALQYAFKLTFNESDIPIINGLTD